MSSVFPSPSFSNRNPPTFWPQKMSRTWKGSKVPTAGWFCVNRGTFCTCTASYSPQNREAWGESSHTVHNHSGALTHKPPKEGSKSRFQTPVTSALIMDRCFSRIKKRWHSKKKKSHCCHPSHITLRDCVRTSLFPPPSSASPCFSTKKVTSTTVSCHHCFWRVRNSEVEEQRGLSLRNVLHTGSFSRENEISFF